MYRAHDGRKCAIGAQIPDEIYTPAMEGLGVRGLLRKHLSVQRLFGGVSEFLLVQLQAAHDRPLDVAEVRDRLLSVGEQYGLNTDAVEAITEWEGTKLWA